MVVVVAKVIIVYESKYGNTKLVAETITDGMSEIEGIEAVVKELRDVDPNKITDFDAILIGSPNHCGGPTRGIKEFVERLGELHLEGKLYAVFDTYLGKKSDYFFERAMKKMEKTINEKVPALKQIGFGLSIKVQGMKGPIMEGELPKCKEFGKKIAIQLKA